MADLSIIQTASHKTGTVAASSTGDVVVSALPGRINKIVITTAGSAALELYNHASASSGAQLVWKSPATTVLGEVYTVNIPVSLGIVGKRQSNTPAYTVSYTEDSISVGGDTVHKAAILSDGGQYSSTHAAGASGAGAALAEPGVLCTLTVLSQGSAATIIYDSASAASGTALFSVPASGTTSVAAGTVYNLQMPCASGIYVGGATNTSQVVVSYLKNTPSGL